MDPFRSQHAPVRASDDPPYLGRDPLDHGCSIFAIVQSLQQLCLGHKAATLLCWLGRFEGLEQHLEDDADPVLCVCKILLQHVADQPVARRRPSSQPADIWHSIVMQILAQPFVHTCSDWSSDGLKSRIRWNPLAQSFMDFLAMGLPGEELSVWSPTQSKPERVEQSAKLLQELEHP